VNLAISGITRNVLVGVSGFSLLMVGLEELKKKEISSLIELKKKRLQMPFYELKDDELVNFPWNHDNLQEWLYRPIKIKGRVVHRNTTRAPYNMGQSYGFHSFIPLITKEAEDRDPATRNGIYVNLGWSPEWTREAQFMVHDWNSRDYIEYTGYVSVGEEHNKFLFKKANVACEQWMNMQDFYLPDMARVCGFQNKEQCRVAVIDICDFESEKLNEKCPRLYSGGDLARQKEYPYEKTLAGALQCSSMPWEIVEKQKAWSLMSFLTIAVALTAKIH